MTVVEAGVYIDGGHLGHLAVGDGVGIKIGRTVNAELEVYLAVPAVGVKRACLGVGVALVDGGEAAVCDLAEVVEIACGLVCVGGEQECINAAVIEAVAFDDAAVVNGGDLLGGGVVAHQRAAGGADGRAAEVDLAVVGADVV